MFVAIERFELPLTESESVVLTITLKGNIDLCDFSPLDQYGSNRVTLT